MSDAAFGTHSLETTGEATLGERAWLAQQRRLEVRIDDVRLELLDGARSRHDAVLQAAGNIVRKALVAGRQEFERLGGLISAQDKVVARLEAEASEQREVLDQRFVDVRAEIEQQVRDELVAERDRREEILVGQGQNIADLRAEIAAFRVEAVKHERTIDARFDAFWTELGRRVMAEIAAEREQRERVVAEQASLLATREREITTLEAKFLVEKAEASERLAAFRGDVERQIATGLKACDKTIATQAKLIEAQDAQIVALESRLTEQKAAFDKRLDEVCVDERFVTFRMDMGRQIATGLKACDETIATQAKLIEAQGAQIVALEARLTEQGAAFDKRHELRAESERTMAAQITPLAESITALWSANTNVRQEIERAATVGQAFGEERDNQREAFAKINDRVLALETTNSFEERFTKLAHEIKNESDIPQSELLARIDGLQRQVDELKRAAAQPGPQGPPGPAGKLPCVKEYVAERVHYEAEVVTHAGALWQARGDTVHAPPHADWTCLARAGRDGQTPIVRGAYDVHEAYKELDIVALDGAAFIAGHDNPGICPGNGWELLSRQGRPGRRGETGERGVRGEKGERGEPGEPAVTIASWQVDRRRYAVAPMMSDGNVGAILPLRELFEQFLFETS